MTSDELRKKFIDYFVDKGHKELPPATLIPENDPSVLFTTAGMQQFKKYYTHPEEAPSKNVVTCQPCVRTSDIDEVGDDTHVTLLEMLGNFSFGGYFKKEAIEYAWEFLTAKDWLNIDKKRISATYFDSEKANLNKLVNTDTESLEILQTLSGLEKIDGCGDDNFWSLGTLDSPGGPTVEFYIDGIEVWNLVFNEEIWKGDHWQDSNTEGIDTGMGLERIVAVINGSKDVYEIDSLKPLIGKISTLASKKYQEFPREFRIIADHVRAVSFMAAQKIESSNIGRGYIVRRLVRRATRRGKLLGITEPFLADLGREVVRIFTKSYPFIKENEALVLRVLTEEENKFRKPLDWVDQYRQDLLAAKNDNIVKKIKNVPILSKPGIASGEYIYENFQTYGVPPDLSGEVARELGLEVDQAGFDRLYKKHQDVSRSASAGMFKGGLVGESEITTRMHTATHLLLKALQEVLGPEVHQRGSNINEERIRFDFSYSQALTEEEIKKVENIVDEKITEDLPVVKKEATVEEAKAMGAEAQFIEKYKQYGNLTMYSIGDFSHELCGGPHVRSTGEIGKFKITKEESSSAGVRRIRAILE